MDYGKKISIGGFTLFKYQKMLASSTPKPGKRVKETLSYIRISTIGGEWAVEYRADNKIFNLLDSVSGDDYEPFRTFITSLYGASHTIDGEFTNDVILSMNKYFERLPKPAELSEEEDAAIVADMKCEWEMKEELKKK